MPHNRKEREQEIRDRFEFVVFADTEASIFNAALGVVDAIVSGGTYTLQYIQSELGDFGIKVASEMATAGVNPVSEPIYSAVMTFQNWEQPIPGTKIPLPNKFVPYVAARKRAVQPNGFAGLAAVTALGNRLYVVWNDRLHRVSTGNGSWEVVGDPEWAGPGAITALLDRLYIVQNDRLHRVNPDNGAWEVLGGADWIGPAAVTALGNRLFIVQNDRLHRVNPDNGAWEVLGGADWIGPAAMTGLDGRLYVIQSDWLHRVNPNNGAWEVRGNPDWNGQAAITASGDRLFVIQNRRLHRVDPSSGAWEVLGEADWG